MQPTVIKLSGSLAQRFGREHVRYLDSGSVYEAMRALKNTLDGFERAILELAERGIEFTVFKNGKNITKENLIEGGAHEVRVVPAITGSKSGGLFGTILGGVLIAASFIPGLNVISTGLLYAGIGMAAAGALQMLSPQPKIPKTREQEGNDPSYAFGGAISTTAAGHPVPVLYGRREIGGAYISASITAEEYA